MKACQRHCLTYYLFCFFTYYILAITVIYLCTCSIWTEKAMATHSSTLAWKVPWTEEPGGLQSMGSRRVGHDWATSFSLFTFMHWRRKWQPTPVFLPGEFQGQGSLVGCRLWGRTESDATEATYQQQQQYMKVEKAMAPHSSTLAWKIPWTEEPGRLQSMGSLRVGHDWATSLSLFTFMHWRRKWQPTQSSCLENPRDGVAWWAAVYGVAQSRTRVKWLSSSSSSSIWKTSSLFFNGWILFYCLFDNSNTALMIILNI